MRRALKVAVCAGALGLAAAGCLPEDDHCEARNEADAGSLIQVRGHSARAAQALGGGPYPSGCAESYNHDYGVYNEPGCSGGLVGCKADGVHQNCRYCGAPASGAGYVYEDCPCPTPPSNCTGYNEYYCVYTDPTCSKESQPGCLGFNDCRYCGRGQYGPCPDAAPPPAPEPSTTATTTMTYQPCNLGVSVFAPPDSSGGPPGGDLASYGVPAWKCTQADPDNSTVFFTSSWSRPDVFPTCTAQTLGTVSWFRASDCSGTPFASQTLFTDGDTNRGGCRDATGGALDPAWCRGSWR